MVFWLQGKTDGVVIISEAFEDPQQAKLARDRLRAPDLEVSSRFTALNLEDALKQAKLELE